MFKMYLQHKSNFDKVNIEEKEYDDELDYAISIVSDICKYFHQTNSIEFIVSGFGSELWPVDCHCDLPLIIEDLPEIIRNFGKNEYNFRLGFYEQGVMREVAFREEGGKLNLECKSLIPGWLPTPSHIVMEKSDVKKMIEELFESFIDYSKKICPELLNEKHFKEWLLRHNIFI